MHVERNSTATSKTRARIYWACCQRPQTRHKRSERATYFFSQAVLFFLESNFQIGASVHELRHITFCERCPPFRDDPISRWAAKLIEIPIAPNSERSASWLLTMISGKSLA